MREQPKDVEESVAVEVPNIEDPPQQKPLYIRAMIWILDFFIAYDFPILLLAAIGVAKAAPEFGAVHLAPQYTATWIAVALIFFLSGVALKTEQFASAFAKYRFNAYVLIYNFGFVSAVIFGISSALKTGRILSPFLADGLIACGALPMAVNTVSVLTAGCHGDEAVAIFDEAVSNLIGVFLSPLIIRGYLGKLPGMNLPDIFWKLIVRVLVPLFVGQLVRYSSKQVVDFANKYKSGLSRAQKYLLVFIVYTIFCKTFLSNTGTGIGDVFTLVLVIFILQIFFLTVTWTVTHILYHDQPKLRVVGLFGAVAKTVALGIPLIQSLYENNPRVGVYTLPILIWHPMLLVVGSCLTPFVRSYVDSELERIEKASPQDDASKVDEPNREFGREETFEGESDEETPTVHSS